MKYIVKALNLEEELLPLLKKIAVGDIPSQAAKLAYTLGFFVLEHIESGKKRAVFPPATWAKWAHACLAKARLSEGPLGKSLEKHGKAWESVEKHGIAWKIMGKHRKAWKSMGKHGKHGKAWKSIGFLGWRFHRRACQATSMGLLTEPGWGAAKTYEKA